jgi:hypothetical protein
MDGHEPEMGLGGLDHLVDFGRRVKPIEKQPHLVIEPRRRRRLKLYALVADGAGNNLHGAAMVIAPRSGYNARHAAAAAGKQAGMPSVQPLGG